MGIRPRNPRSLRTFAAAGAALIALSTPLLTACGSEQASGAQGSTITISVLDDPTRRMAFWALENGKVDLGGVRVKITYTPTQSAQQAYQSKQYDVVEASPVAIALAATKGLKTRILSAGIQNRDATVVDVPSDSNIRRPEDLKGKKIAISAPSGSSTVELRYVLDKGYGLQAKEQGGDVHLQVVPPDATMTLVKNGSLDAAVELNRPRYLSEFKQNQKPALHVSKEAAHLTGAASVQTVLVTYPNIEQSRATDLRKLVKAMRASTAYARAHQDEVGRAVAMGNSADTAYLKWWWSTADLRFGSLGAADKAGVESFWTMAHDVGLLGSIPRFDSLRSSAAPAA